MPDSTPLSQPAQPSPSSPAVQSTTRPAPAIPTPTASASDPQAILRRMSLEEKVGQVLVIGFDGPQFDRGLRRMIEEYHIGGVIFFARNVERPAQTVALTNALQNAALASGHPGLIIAIDQEGGRVARLTEDKGYTEFPGAMAIAATGDPENARRVAAALASEMRAIGINTDFAPDLDVNNNPANPIIGIRSFGADPQMVAEYGVAFLQGLQDNGVMAFGKHFPGHGDTSVDSHVNLPEVPHSLERLKAIEFVPFQAAIQADVAGIMSAHITFPAIDPTPGLAATLSPTVLTRLLRQELGYDGLLVTDSLEMGALAESGYPVPLAAATALQAGADLLLFNRDHNLHQAAYRLILEWVQSGQIPQNRLDDAVLRVLQAKARFGLLIPIPVDPDAAARSVGQDEQRRLSREVALQGLTLLKDDAGLLPLPADRSQALVVEGPQLRGLGQLLGSAHLSVSEHPTRSEIASAAAMARQRPLVIVATSDAPADPQQVTLVQALQGSGTPVLVIAMRGPWDITAFPEISTYIAAYGANPPAREALLSLLTAAEPVAAGRLPVPIPRLYAAGAPTPAP